MDEDARVPGVRAGEERSQAGPGLMTFDARLDRSRALFASSRVFSVRGIKGYGGCPFTGLIDARTLVS